MNSVSLSIVSAENPDESKEEIFEEEFQRRHDEELKWSESVYSSMTRRRALETELWARAHSEAAFLTIEMLLQEGKTVSMRLLERDESGLWVVNEARAHQWVTEQLLAAEGAISGRAYSDSLRNMDAAAAFEVPTYPYSSLADAFAMDLPSVAYSVDGLCIANGNTLLSAYAKVGKTTLVMAYCKSRVDGTPFLGQESRKIEGNISYYDAELEPAYAVGRFAQLDIEHPEKILHRPVKGYALPLTTERCQQWVIKDLLENNTEIWIIDTFGKIFDGDEDSNTEVRAFLHAIEIIKRKAGVKEVVIVHHTGHGKDGQKARARGASYFLGWSDNNWTYEPATKSEGETKRILRVSGRGDLLSSVTVDYDLKTAEFVRVEGAVVAASRDIHQEVVHYLQDNPDSSITDVSNGLGIGRDSARAVLSEVHGAGTLTMKKGARNSKRFSVAPLVSSSVDVT